MMICNQLWEDEWFCSLEQRHKMLYLYLLFASSNCGVFELNMRKINYDLSNGTEHLKPYTKEEVLAFAGKRIVMLPNSDTKAIMSNYIYFNWVRNGFINPADKAVMSVIRELRSYGLTIDDINKLSKRQIKFKGEANGNSNDNTNDIVVLQRGQLNDEEKKKKIANADAEVLFEGFWKTYRESGCPRMSDKPKCKAKYIKYLHDAKDAVQLSNAIHNGLMAWRASDTWKKDGGQFIMNPYRWLNGRNWETPPTKGNGNGYTKSSGSANSNYVEAEDKPLF